MITAMVTDASGNGVGGLALSGAAESGTVGEFSAGSADGSYIAQHTARVRSRRKARIPSPLASESFRVRLR